MNPVCYPELSKGGSNGNFYIWCCLSCFVAGNHLLDTSHLVWVEHSNSQPTDDKLSLKGAWSLSRELFNFWKISDNISKTVQDSLIVSIKFE